MTIKTVELGELSDVAAVGAVTALGGLRVVDVGCGPGDIARGLVASGATVIAAEPDSIQAGKNRNAVPLESLVFVEAGAEKLPIADASMDGVFFFRSLHHVPVDIMDVALVEAARVLKPETGFLCVVEPGMTGSHFQVMRPFHDETMVRTEAQAALARTASKLFLEEARYRYTMTPRYPDFEAMVARVTGQSFNNIHRDRVETDEVRALFEAGRTAAGDYAFDQPMLLNLYRKPIAGGWPTSAPMRQ
jgi:ubiquinone/menaquinone biosynthesis C-methylase UbiE